MSNLQNTEFEARFAAAQADTTSAEALAELASDSEVQIRQAVARNPNTSIGVLSSLGEEFPDEVTENPIFKILLLEHPDSHFVRLSLARSTTTDESTLTRLSKIKSEEILCAVARNLSTPLSVLEGFVYDPPLFYDFDRLFRAIALNPKTPESLLLKLVESGSFNVKIAIAANPKAPISLLEQGADWRNAEMHAAIAQNPKTPVAILEKLAGEDSWTTRELVKQHPNVSETAIAIIDFVEGRPGTPVQLLKKLVGDHRSSVRRLVASHPRTPGHTLDILVEDPDVDIRWMVARHPNILAESLEKLVSSFVDSNLNRQLPPYEERLYLQLFRHPKITAKALDKLADVDVSEGQRLKDLIAADSRTSLDTLIKLAGNGDQFEYGNWEVLTTLGRDINTPPSVLEQLVENPVMARIIQINPSVVQTVVQNPNLPIHLIEKLSISKYKYLRAGVAKNPSTPIHILEKLVLDSESMVCAGVLANPRMAEFIELLAESPNPKVRGEIAKNSSTPILFLMSLARDESELVRAAVAENINTPPSILELLLDDTTDIRCSIASNVKTPINLLLILAQDDHHSVRVKLAQRPHLSGVILENLAEKSLSEVLTNSESCFLTAEQFILMNVAANSNTPMHTLKKLLDFPTDSPQHRLIKYSIQAATLRL